MFYNQCFGEGPSQFRAGHCRFCGLRVLDRRKTVRVQVFEMVKVTRAPRRL